MPIIKTVQGDLIKLAKQGHFQVIIQGNNCFAIQGAGIAPQIAKAFGGEDDLVRQVDRDFPIPIGSKERLGNYSYLQTDEVLVINAYTQHSTGGRRAGKPDVSYDAIREVFEKLNTDITSHLGKNATVGIPLIGCGLAGGNWEVVETLIDEVTPDLNIILVKYQPE